MVTLKARNAQQSLFDKLRNGCGLFQKFTDEEMVTLFRLIKPERFKKGRVIFHRGDPACHIYIVISGAVEVFIPREPANVITKLCEGQIFGEMGILHGHTRNASVRAVEETQLFSISEDVFADNINIMLLLKIYKNLARIVSMRATNMVRHQRNQFSIT